MTWSSSWAMLNKMIGSQLHPTNFESVAVSNHRNPSALI